MYLKNRIKNSLIYSLKSYPNYIIFGIILSLLDVIPNLFGNRDILAILASIIVTLVLFIEIGYLATIIGDTIHGKDILPKFKNMKSLIIKGIKETIIVIGYLVIPMIIALTLILEVIVFDNMVLGILIAIFLIVVLIFSVFFIEGAILNFEYHHSRLKPAFDIKTIYHKIKNMGISEFIIALLFLSSASFVVELIFEGFIFDLGILGSILFNFLLMPFLAIFSSRFLGLIGRHYFTEN